MSSSPHPIIIRYDVTEGHNFRNDIVIQNSRKLYHKFISSDGFMKLVLENSYLARWFSKQRFCGQLLFLWSPYAVRYMDLGTVTSNVDTGLEAEGAADALVATLSQTLRESSQPNLCSIMLISDSTVPHTTLRKIIAKAEQPRGYSVVELELPEFSDGNVTEETMDIPDVITDARKFNTEVVLQHLQVRLASWCLTVGVVTEDLRFLEWLARAIQKGRLLVWTTSMVVLSRIQHSELLRLLRGPWTYSMMRTVFVNQPPEIDSGEDSEKWMVYSQQPYSPGGGSKVLHLASWSPKRGLMYGQLPFFREKYENCHSRRGPYCSSFSSLLCSFHGTVINITALPYAPYWEDAVPGRHNGTGTDFFLLETIARILNMKFRVIPVETWGQVVQKVQERVSFFSPIFHLILPRRLESYDFSYAYEFVPVGFSMAKPELKPQWQSLYYPLTNEVWVAILAIVIFILLPLYVFSRIGRSSYDPARDVVEDTLLVVGTLFGQGLQQNLPNRTSYRMLLGFWLIFAFIISVAYRGNLTASLTSPKYPPRAEDIFDLVHVGARVGIPSYGQHIKNFLLDSDSPVYRSAGKQIEIVPTFMDGLQRVINENFAYLDSRLYMELQLARHFTRPDGSLDHYVAREAAFHGLAGWPFPHDAPYKHVFDKRIMYIIEAGLYEKWRRDMLENARIEGQRKANENRVEKEDSGERSKKTSAGVALTLTHMQGPLYLLLIGCGLGFLVLCFELLQVRFNS
ncbi:ionotropic receptor 93a-like [Oratosquilla oratoria]|uniref:ionotropic receptor 93a-like n=1 Tax=Oratosquilla oratoria TaxID=337810 RepID=UPI003F76165F